MYIPDSLSFDFSQDFVSCEFDFSQIVIVYMAFFLVQVYGNFQAKATMDGMLLANPDKRPFVLSRAGFIGNQRFSATWSGDNLSNWEHLAMSVPMALNLVS